MENSENEIVLKLKQLRTENLLLRTQVDEQAQQISRLQQEVLQYKRAETIQNNNVGNINTERSRIFDILLLCEAMSRKIKKAELSEVAKLTAVQQRHQQNKRSESMDALEMLKRVNRTLDDLENKIDECRRIYLASEESSSSLFTLLPFSSGSITELIYSAHCSFESEQINHEGEFEPDELLSKQNITQRISRLFFDLAQELVKIKKESNDIKYAMLEPVVEKHKILIQKQSDLCQHQEQSKDNLQDDSDLERSFLGEEEDDEEAQTLDI